MMTLGILAGISTAIFWACSSCIHSNIARVMGVHSFMMLRQPFASFILLILCIIFGQIESHSTYLILLVFVSGIVGVGGADWCVYESASRIGLRPALVCHSLSTSVTAVLGVLFLDEYLGWQGALGIAVATSGVMLVITAEGRHKPITISENISKKQQMIGVALALLSAICLALAFLWTKEALIAGMSPLYVTFLRNLAASAALWVVGIRLHRVKGTWKKFKLHPELIKLYILGCFFGPVGGIWLASVALEYSPAAVAATLIGLQPVALLFVSGIAEKRMPCIGSIIGSLIACGGAVILIWR